MCVGACSTPSTDPQIRTTLASNTEWTLVGVGDLKPPADDFAINRVVFEAYRKGELFASGELRLIGSDDGAFSDRYTKISWERPNVVHFSRHYSAAKRVEIRVINDGEERVQYLRLDATGIVLVLDVAAGESTTFPVEYGDHVYLTAQGALSNGSRLNLSSQTFESDTALIRLVIKNQRIAAFAE